MLIAYLAGIVLTYIAAALLGSGVGQPFGPAGLAELTESLVFGGFVLLQRAALGFAVAMVLRSQLAGVVVGIVLYIAEPILSAIMLALTVGGNFSGGMDDIGVQWHQFLPFTIGNSVLSGPETGGGGGFQLTPIALETALLGVGIYLVVSIGIAMLSLRRAEVAG
jgi:ABC-type transport system involved in multi-copper enzyme maturation permease subunit